MIFVLDTSVLLNYPGELSNLMNHGEIITSPLVIGEIKKEPEKSMIQLMVKGGMRIISPSKNVVGKVREEGEKMGEYLLSKTDIEVIALALEEGGVLFTEDYSIQNLSEVLGVAWKSLSTKGINRVHQWGYKCKACGRIYKKKMDSCPICGGELIRWRIKRRRKINLNNSIP